MPASAGAQAASARATEPAARPAHRPALQRRRPVRHGRSSGAGGWSSGPTSSAGDWFGVTHGRLMRPAMWERAQGNAPSAGGNFPPCDTYGAPATTPLQRAPARSEPSAGDPTPGTLQIAQLPQPAQTQPGPGGRRGAGGAGGRAARLPSLRSRRSCLLHFVGHRPWVPTFRNRLRPSAGD